MVRGITSYSSYLPVHRLSRDEIGSFLGQPVQPGSRTVAGFDEDSSTMAVEALRALDAPSRQGPLWFATTRPAYLEKANSSLVHDASGLASESPGYDVVGSVRSGFAAIRAAYDSHGMAAVADVRIGRPESPEESTGCDGAAAIAFGDDDVLAEVLAIESATIEVLDRWRLPDSLTVEVWDDRFSPEVFLPMVNEVVGRVVGSAGVSAVDHLALSCGNSRLAATIAGALGAAVSSAMRTLGFAGAAQVGLSLADALDRAEPDQTILVLAVADGVDAMVLRTTSRLSEHRASRSLADQHGAGRPVSYAAVLTWRGLLERQPPRRPDPQAPASPPSYRDRGLKMRLSAGRCRECATVTLPAQRVCLSCGALDAAERIDLADSPGTIATLTADRLAYSLSPPVLMAVVDFDAGGRAVFEVADADAASVTIGTRVEPTFRRLATSEGIHNYFWKVRPLRSDRGE